MTCGEKNAHSAGPEPHRGGPGSIAVLSGNAAIAVLSVILSLLAAEAGLRLTPYGELVARPHFSSGTFEQIGENYDLKPGNSE